MNESEQNVTKGLYHKTYYGRNLQFQAKSSV